MIEASAAPRKANLVLLQDEDLKLCRAVCDELTAQGLRGIALAGTRRLLETVALRSPRVVVSDAAGLLGGSNNLLGDMRSRVPDARVMLMAERPSIPDVVRGMQLGAVDFLEKPITPSALVARVKRHLEPAETCADVVNESMASRRCFDLACRVAATDISVLLSGESGTGKEVVARFIHRNSPRAEGPFIAINCAAIPEQMLEAILFGHERGAFTGAHRSRSGKFEAAHRGTLLLDEVSEMSLPLQAKLLRVLQEREVERVGSHDPISVDVRVVATTNRDLSQAIEEGSFREDLFYRLSVFPLSIAPLRDRVEDIRPLARRFLIKYGASAGRANAQLSEEAMVALERHDWPGNVRELENAVQRALVMATDLVIKPEDVVTPEIDGHAGQRLADELKQKEFDLVLRQLRQFDGARVPTAKALGISERTLRYKLRQMRDVGLLPD